MQELDGVLAVMGVDLTRWKLINATPISDCGFAIIGNGLNRDGQREAWIAIIPEPNIPSLAWA